MGTANRREILGRMAALVAGPLLLGRQALDLTLRSVQETPPNTPQVPTDPPVRISITPPSHSIKRRG